jgi:hypothetical protein
VVITIVVLIIIVIASIVVKPRYVLSTTVCIANNDRPWFNSELRREIRIRDRIRKTAKKYNKQSDIDKYQKQRNRVNNLKKIAKEHFELN